MSYTFIPSSPIGTVRTLIGDTTEASARLSDEEISSLLTVGVTPLKTAALAIRRIASSLLYSAKHEQAGNYKIDTRQAYRELLEVANDYEKADREYPADAQVEVIYNDFNYRNILRNKVLRLESIYESN